MSGLRIVCVTPYGPHGRGGIDRLYRYLREARLPADDIEVRYFAGRGDAPGNAWVLTFPWRALRFLGLLATWRPDVVHLNFAIGGSVFRKYVLLRLAALFGARTAVHFHGNFTARDVARGTPMMRCFVDLCRRADRVIVLGSVYGRAFADIVGVRPERIAVIHNGTPDIGANVALPKAGSGPVRLLFCGLLGPGKGADVLVDGLAALARRGVAFSCTIAGNGDVATYEAMARAHGLALEQARFTGWVEAAEVSRLALEADIVLLPSRAENLPLTLIEGACAGAALVATPVGEVAEILVEGRNGLTIPVDAGALARAVERLAADRPELARMQVASRAIYVERFSLDGFGAALHRLYRELGEAPAGSTSAGTSEIGTV